MVETLNVASPADIRPNPENPRLIFHESELEELRSSIEENGILVPLTVYGDDDGSLVLLDGERRWRCAKRLGLARVPVIIQPRPSAIQNIMMMFAIHNARADWDPLPTAMKLDQLAQMWEGEHGRPPSEKQLAQLASLTRGEVRRLRNILGLPKMHLDRVMEQQNLPRSEQRVTVDHVLEVTRAARLLHDRSVVSEATARKLEVALLDKFERRDATSTVDPRLLIRASRAVQRGDVSAQAVSIQVDRLISEPAYTIREAYQASVDVAETHRTLELTTRRLVHDLVFLDSGAPLSEDLRTSLTQLKAVLDAILGR